MLLPTEQNLHCVIPLFKINRSC